MNYGIYTWFKTERFMKQNYILFYLSNKFFLVKLHCIFPYFTSFHSLLTCVDNLQSKSVTRNKINITATKCREILGLEPLRRSLDTWPASTLLSTEPWVCYCHNNEVGYRGLPSRYITLPGGVFNSPQQTRTNIGGNIISTFPSSGRFIRP